MSDSAGHQAKLDQAKLDRTWLCSVVFMDVVGYSSRSVQVQMHLKHRFNEYLSEAIKDVAENDRVILDTGDGAAICFLGDPEVAMFSALKLQSCFARDDREHQPGLRVRIGVNLGPLKLVRDINGNLNAIGEGINSGQRVMSFAGENQILVSRSFYEVVGCLSDSYGRLFRFEGVKKDKHVREHLVYELVPPSADKSADQAWEQIVAVAPPEPAIDPEMLRKLEAVMLPLLGPVARHMVKTEAQTQSNFDALVQKLADHFSVKHEREAFLAAVRVEFNFGLPPPAIAVPLAFDVNMLEKARHELAAHIGPMAKLIVDRAIKQARPPEEFLDALAIEVPPKDRDRFRSKLAGR